ncbi:MAG: ABC transporter permease [Rhodospirillales bacterium]
MWRRIIVVFLKETIDNSRDRRSLLVALIYPLLGPILLGLMISAVVGVVVTKTESKVTLAVQGAGNAPSLISFLKTKGIEATPAPADPKSAVINGALEMVVVIPEQFNASFKAEKTATITIISNSSRLTGLIAINRLASHLSAYNSEVWNKRINKRGFDVQVLRPLSVKTVDVTSGTHISKILLFMVPPLFIFNLFMGGVYLAIDTTSGERERGSLEPLLINPVERWGLMLGKYMAALLYTAIAVMVQLLAFKAVFQFAGGGSYDFSTILPLAAVVGIFMITLPLMMVAVGVQFIIATLTSSFKEAQTYLGLLPLVPAIPGMILVFVPVQAQKWMMMIPTFSQTLLMGQFVRGEPLAWGNVVLSLASSTLAAFILIFLAARLYERENLIFGE